MNLHSLNPIIILLTTLSFLSLSLTLDVPPIYRIDISASGKNNTLSLTKGQFHPITIEIHSIYGNFDKKLQTTVLHVSDDRFIMPQASYYVNTSDTLAIRTFIGVDCNSTFTEDELANGVQIRMETENESFQPQNVSVTVSEAQIELNLNISDNTLGLNTYGVVYPGEAVLNTNPITILFEVDAQHNESLLFDNEHNELVINASTLDYAHFYAQTKKFYVNTAKVDSDVNDISITASIKDNTCYALSERATSFNVSIKADVKETDVTQSEIAFEGVVDETDNVMYFTLSQTLSKNVVYGSMSCAIVANDLAMVSDVDIQQQQYPSDAMYEHRLTYFNVHLGENNNNNIKIPLTTIDKYRKYNYRCIYANNAYRSEHAKSIVVENKRGEFIDATQALLFGYPSCWEAHIHNLTQPIIYDENIGRYASLNIYEGGRDNYDENGCLKFAFRNVDEYYASERAKNVTVKSFCVYSAPTCNVTKFDWNTMASAVETKLTKVMTDKYKVEEAAGVTWINIESMRQIYFVNLNADQLKLSRYIKHDKSQLQLTLNNVHNEPVECLYNFSTHDQAVNATVFAKENKIKLRAGRNDDIVLSLPFTTDNDVYSLKLLCNSIPGWDVTETVDNAFTAFYFVHDDKTEFNCEDNKQQLVCLHGRIDRQEFNDLETNVKGIDAVINEVDAFKTKTYTEKKDALATASANVDAETSAIKMFPLGIEVDEYIALVDCNEGNEYERCVTMKKEYESKVMTKLMNTIYKSEGNVSTYINSFVTDNTMVDVLSQLLIKCLTLGNVADALTEETSKQALNLTYSLLNEINDVVNNVQTAYKDDANYNNIIKDVVTLYFKAASSMLNVVKYMDVQKFIAVNGDASRDYFIQDELLTNYVNVLTRGLSSLLVKTETTAFENANYKYTYLPLNVTNLYDEHIVNEVSITYNEGELVKAGVIGVSVLTHKTYPLLSEFKDAQTYATYIFGLNVVTSTGMNAQLPTPIELVYDRTLLGMNLTQCYRVVEGKLTTEGITSKVDTEMNVLTCGVLATGDVIATTKEIHIDDDKGFPMWVIILAIVAVLLIVVGIIMWFKCCKSSSPVVIIPTTGHDPLVPKQ